MSAKVIQQPSVASAAGVTDALTGVFVAMRTAVLAGEGVVLVLDDRDLLGQGDVVDAAVATAMLGLLRAFALEGARDGWQVNAVTHRGEAEAVEDAVALLGGAGAAALTGQVLRLGTAHIGKVLP